MKLITVLLFAGLTCFAGVQPPFVLSPAFVGASAPRPPNNTTNFSDDFNRANSTSLGTAWVEVGGLWGITNNTLHKAEAGTFGSVIYTNTICSSNWQAGRFELEGPATANYSIGLRCTASGSTGYFIEFSGNGSTVSWYTESATLIAQTTMTLETNRYYAASVVGYDNATEIRIWTNAAIASVNIADVTSPYHFGGVLAPDFTFVTDPGANARNNGQYIALGVYQVSGRAIYDNFSGAAQRPP